MGGGHLGPEAAWQDPGEAVGSPGEEAGWGGKDPASLCARWCCAKGQGRGCRLPGSWLRTPGALGSLSSDGSPAVPVQHIWASQGNMARSADVVAMDCEMVGLGPFRESGLARCSLVDYHGSVLYDKFIRPEGDITDYRTPVSGITARNMEGAAPFAVARLEVSEGQMPARPTHTHTPPHIHAPLGLPPRVLDL